MACFGNNNEDDIVDTIRAMRIQEEKSYLCRNCYHQSTPLSPSGVAAACSPHEAVTTQTRNVLCDWANKIIDFCSLDRETVEIAMSYVDRFAASAKGKEVLQKSDRFQLLVVTALYVAIKVHETVAISTSQFEKISRNTFTSQDLESMERILLEGLEWKLHPPTSLGFVRSYMELVPSLKMSQAMKDTAFILCKVQTELAVRDSALVSARASTIAFASLLNAFEALGMSDSASGSFTVHCFVSKVANLSLVNKAVFYDQQILAPVQARLHQAIAKQTSVPAFMDASPAPQPCPMTPPSKQGAHSHKTFENTPRSIIGRSL
ncbi:diatom-specific cyclin [Seminavis robusta]|uniref:Diatom-specific cyclin n=1 Tax=Seminavis robusta TaxID=568900 RepID=A0A9N8DQH2_9STRA|nr:diatom-specific cyclin [Seminavis robusta]|eukprot:Sro299_g111340.1 diatom-specific cyclin (320) ;mRNA; r:30157-31116